MKSSYFDPEAILESVVVVKEEPQKEHTRQDSFTVNELFDKLAALLNDCDLFSVRRPMLYSIEEMERFPFVSPGAIIYDENLRKKAISEIVALIKLHLKSNGTKGNICSVVGFFVVYIFGLCMSKASAPFRVFFNNALSRVPAL